jgi:hypothetical protein
MNTQTLDETVHAAINKPLHEATGQEAEIVLKSYQAWREVSVAAQIVAGIKTMGVN